MTELANVVDIDETNFESTVLVNSESVLVMVDFWADWCAPCGMLAPILTNLAAQYPNQLLLAKVNTDQLPHLAQQFGVRSLPTVKLFRNGNVVDEFIGVESESMIKAMIERNLPRASDQMVSTAKELLASGDIIGAKKELEKAFASDKDNHDIRISLAKVYVSIGDFSQAESLLNELPINLQSEGEVKLLQTQLKFAKLAGKLPPIASIKEKLNNDKDNLDARYQYAISEIIQQNYESAMRQLLLIIGKDRQYKDEIGRKTMLEVFELLGNQGPLVSDYRKKMSRLLN